MALQSLHGHFTSEPSEDQVDTMDVKQLAALQWTRANIKNAKQSPSLENWQDPAMVVGEPIVKSQNEAFWNPAGQAGFVEFIPVHEPIVFGKPVELTREVLDVQIAEIKGRPVLLAHSDT